MSCHCRGASHLQLFCMHVTESAALVQAYILQDTFLAQNMRDSGIEKCRDQGLKKGTFASAASW